MSDDSPTQPIHPTDDCSAAGIPDRPATMPAMPSIDPLQSFRESLVDPVLRMTAAAFPAPGKSIDETMMELAYEKAMALALNERLEPPPAPPAQGSANQYLLTLRAWAD